MLTTLKSGSTVLVEGHPVHVCNDVEVEIDESRLNGLSEAAAHSLNIPCTRRHPHPPVMSATPGNDILLDSTQFSANPESPPVTAYYVQEVPPHGPITGPYPPDVLFRRLTAGELPPDAMLSENIEPEPVWQPVSRLFGPDSVLGHHGQ